MSDDQPLPTDFDAARLAEIATQWTWLAAAHCEGEGAAAAQAHLLERYRGAVQRYLLASLRDANAADDAFQDFAVRFVRGGFRNASPAKGRFRDYLKSALSRLILDHKRRSYRDNERRVATDDIAEVAGAAAIHFEDNWREELLARSWRALESCELSKGRPYYTLLRLRTDYPDDAALELATRLQAKLGEQDQLSEAALRKLLQRAREMLKDLLLDEVAASLGTMDWAEIEEELAALELLSYCQSSLARRRAGP